MSTTAGVPLATAADVSQPPPPIIEILQLAWQLTLSGFNFLGTLTNFMLSAVRTATIPFSTIISVVYAPISYILSPFVLAAKLVINAFVLAPYSMIKSILADLYPIYAFVVVACIYAAVIGLCARGVSQLAKNILMFPYASSTPPATKPVVIKKEPPPAKPRRVSIKEAAR